MPSRPPRWKTKAPLGAAPRRLERFDGPRRSIVLSSDDPARTLEVGHLIGQLVPSGAVLSLEGGLGAGKTLIAKGICAGLGVSDEILSPSFILAEEYAGAFRVFHFDLYRLDRVDEVDGIGLFDAVDGRNIVIIEWGDRLPAGTLEADVRIVMKITGERTRTITIEAWGGFLAPLEGSIE